MDVSPRGLAISKVKLDAAGYVPRLLRAGMSALPFADATFGAVVAIHVLYHGRRREVAAALAEVQRVLTPSGVLVATFLSSDTWKYGEGEPLEPETWVQARGPEAGIPHHYCDESSLRALLAAFTLDYLHHDIIHADDGLQHAHWEVIARRP